MEVYFANLIEYKEINQGVQGAIHSQSKYSLGIFLVIDFALGQIFFWVRPCQRQGSAHVGSLAAGYASGKIRNPKVYILNKKGLSSGR